MRLRILACVAVVGLFAIPTAQVRGQPLTAEEKKATVAYVLSLKHETGGFAEAKNEKAPATLPATFAAVYALRYFDGEVKDKKGCETFVLSCKKVGVKFADTPDGDVRGKYAPTPDGKADNRMTALAAMIHMEFNPGGYESASSSLKALVLFDAAKTLEDYLLLGEFLLSAKGRVRFNGLGDQPSALVKTIKKSANPDGSFGKDDTLVRDTAAAVIAIQGLGGKIDKADTVAKLLKDTQRPDGGWGKDKSDLETTSRVVHALSLLRGECDLIACRKFVANCRNEDRGYGPQPGQVSNVHATYHAGAALHRLGELPAGKK